MSKPALPATSSLSVSSSNTKESRVTKTLSKTKWLRCSGNDTCISVICNQCHDPISGQHGPDSSSNRCSYCHRFVCSSRLHNDALQRCDVLHCQQRSCASCRTNTLPKAPASTSSTTPIILLSSTPTIASCDICRVKLCHLHLSTHDNQCTHPGLGR
jgi:hypothetical protein